MNSTIQKWGNSLALRIPRALAKDADLRQGSAVDLSVSDGKMIVKPLNVRRYSLALMLRALKPSGRRKEAWS